VASWGGNPPGSFVSGSYDGIARVWKADGSLEFVLGGGHTQAIKSVACVKGVLEKGVVSAGKDQVIMLWALPEKANTQVTPVAACREHTGSVDSVSADPSGSRFASASWDKTIKLWEVAAPSGTGVQTTGSGKKRKANVSDLSSKLTLEGHSEAVSSVDWVESTVIVSGGKDHTIREWDVTNGMCTRVMHHKAVIQGCHTSRRSGHIATAHGDKNVCVWDPRRDAPGPVTKLVSHKGWVSGVGWAPGSDYLLASASFDNTVLFWDTRSPKEALHTLCTHDDKALCVAWNGPGMVVSGGADSVLRTSMLQSSA